MKNMPEGWLISVKTMAAVYGVTPFDVIGKKHAMHYGIFEKRVQGHDKHDCRVITCATDEH